MTQTYEVRIIDFEASPNDIKFSKSINPVQFDNSLSTNLVIGGYAFNLFTPPVIPLGAVFPPATHVRSLEQYGPTGVEYTGNETLPVVADVKTGVGYGANGNEFTGTLVPGGGSGTRRVRFIE